MHKRKRLKVTVKYMRRLLLLLIFVFSTSIGEIYADVQMKTIYHVYVDDVIVGEVNRKEVVETEIEEMTRAAVNKRSDGLNVGVKEEILFVEELTFEKTTEEKETLTNLKKHVTFDVLAVAVSFGEGHVGYFKDQSVVDEMLWRYKAQFVETDVLEEAKKHGGDEPLNITRDQILIKNIALSMPVTTEERVVTKDALLDEQAGLDVLMRGKQVEHDYVVKEDDTISGIANNFDLTTAQLLAINPSLSEKAILNIGQTLTVLKNEPFVDVVVDQEEIAEEIIEKETVVKETNDLYKGEEQTVVHGEDGQKTVTYDVLLKNGVVKEKKAMKTNITKEVVHEVVEVGTKEMPNRGVGTFNWPAVGGYMSSTYGPRWGRHHKGIDIARPSQRDILASDNGVVEKISYDADGYGHYVVINHNNGYKTLYAHLAKVTVTVGQTTPVGTVLGEMGNTGHSTGMHLHFEVLQNGNNIDPETVLN